MGEPSGGVPGRGLPTPEWPPFGPCGPLLGKGEDVLVDDSVVGLGLGVEVASAGVGWLVIGGIVDWGFWLGNEDGGNAGHEGIFSELPSGEPCRICSKARCSVVRPARPSVSPITGSCWRTRCNDALARSGLFSCNAVLASLSSVRTVAAVSTERA